MTTEAEDIEQKKRDDLYHFRYYAGPAKLTNPLTWPNSAKAGVIAFFSTLGYWYFSSRWHKRPFYAGIRMKALVASSAAVAAACCGAFRDYHMRTRDAVVEHYMQLHPEDFVQLSPQSGRKYKDLFMPWTPIRVQERLEPKEL